MSRVGPSGTTEDRTVNLLTVPEVAERLGVSVRTARRLVEGGAVRSVKLGTERRSPRRVRPSDLDAYIRSSLSQA